MPAVDAVAGGAGPEEEFLDFRLGDRSYSIPARFVREIRPLGSYTHQPSLPVFVLGLANVRGRRIVVVDLRALLDLAAAPPQRDAILLIISASRVKIGMLADGVIAVRHADASLARAPVPAAGCEDGWVCGVDRHCNRLLDLPLLLNALRPVIASISQ